MAQKNFFSQLAVYLDLICKADLTNEGIEKLASRFASELKPSYKTKDKDRVNSTIQDLKDIQERKDAIFNFLNQTYLQFSEGCTPPKILN